MKELAVFTAVVVTVTFAQVSFPDSANSGNESNSSSSSSDDIDTEFTDAISDRHFQLLQQGIDRPEQGTSGPQQLPNSPQQLPNSPQQLPNSPQQETVQRGTHRNQCNLPNGSQGNCVIFSQCSPYLNFDLKNPDSVNFLRQSVCRLEGGRAYVCCPNSNNAGEAPTQSNFTPRPFPSPLFPSDTECGSPYETERIIGGKEIEPGSYPWLVALGKPNNHGVYDVNCGGTLITVRHVISAAHCFGGTFKPSHARVGEHDVTHDNDQADPQTKRIKNFILAGYNDDTNQNDLSLLTLESDVTYNAFVQPICLPFRSDLRNEKFVGNHLDIVGWGRTQFRNRQTSPVPLEAKVEVVPLEDCKRAYERLQGPIFINENQLCAGKGGKDTCNGDSGGPINYLDQHTGRYFLAGVTSFGVACGRPDFPGVYARIGAYLEWINNNVN